MPTKIEWVTNPDGTKGETWNPVTGCTKISAGCANCYAERMARRLAGRYGYPEAPNHFDVTLHRDRLDVPLRWRKPRMVFMCSMGDLFHRAVPDTFIRQVWATMLLAPEHTFQVLTKRPARMLELIGNQGKPLSNIWLLVSVENQATADERIPLLLQTPAAVRGVSAEPLLGPIDFNDIPNIPSSVIDPETETWQLDWLIAGGESGPGARPMHPDWARSLRDQAQVAGTPFFMKQWGRLMPYGQEPPGFVAGKGPDLWLDIRGSISQTYSAMMHQPHAFYAVGKKNAGRLLDGRQWNEMPR